MLRIPVLALQGRDDQYGSLAQIAEVDDRAYSPVDMVVLENCRHAPHLEQPAQTLDAVAGFAARLEEAMRQAQENQKDNKGKKGKS